MQPSDYPIEAFIHYLTTYGPGGKTLYDEFVAGAAKRSGVAPIKLVSDSLTQFIELLTSDEPCNVLITGVAGDGKTYLCRQAWEHLKGSVEGWGDKNIVELDIQTVGGLSRRVLFVKDLTDGNYDHALDDPNNILNMLINSISDPTFTLVIACNHGQILKKLRDNNYQPLVTLAEVIEQRFFDKSVDMPKGLFLFDLKQSRQDNMFKKIVKEICSREEWQGCQRCTHCNICPIKKNREALYVNGEFTQITERMALLFRLLELEGLHFPIREQLGFVLNAVLGKSHIPNVPDSLAECHEVRADPNGLVDQIDLFDNLFGRNLTRYKQLNTSTFAAIRRFEIGTATTRFLDSILIDGIKRSWVDGTDMPSLDLSDRFIQSRRRYLGDQPSEETVAEFHDQLKRARRRLFLTWNPEKVLKPSLASSSDFSIWSLTSLPHAREYLLDFVESFEERPNRIKPIDEKLFTGLFQVMTGCRVPQVASELIITTRGAEVSSKAGQLQIASFMHKKSTIYIQAESEASALPVLHFTSNPNQKDTVRFKLTPRRYECLMEISKGYTPSSFSRECISELMGLKSKLIHEYRKTLSSDGRDDETVTITLFSGREIEIQVESEK